MKKIVILSMLLVMGLFATAQTVVLRSAVEACNRGYLDKARKLIDMACNNEETKNDAKTWYYAGLIYSKIGNDPQKSASAPDWCVVASNAIQKCIQLDNEGEYKKECKQINNDIKKYCGQNIASSNPPETKSEPSTIKRDENTNRIQSEVSLVVSADGKSKTEAVNNALRSAIEQTFGTFVSANTEILNDQLVKEEIATVSSGNIQKYTEVTSITLPNGNTSVTLNVTVSLKKLVKYAQSKGSECEFAGATFGANLRLYQFNKKNEQIVIQNMIKQLETLRPIYDYELVLGDPHIVPNSNDRLTEFHVHINVKSNDKTKQFISIITNTLKSLAMTEDQVKPMKDAGFQVVEFCSDKIMNPHYTQGFCYNIKTENTYYLYNEVPVEFGDFLYNILFDFAITDNNGKEYTILEGWHDHVVYRDVACIDGPHIDPIFWGNKFYYEYSKPIGRKFLSYIFIKNDPYYAQYKPYVMELDYDCLIPTTMIDTISRLKIKSTQEESSVFIIRRDVNFSYLHLQDCFKTKTRVHAPYQIPTEVLEVLKKARRENPHPYESLDINELSKQYGALIKQ